MAVLLRVVVAAEAVAATLVVALCMDLVVLRLDLAALVDLADRAGLVELVPAVLVTLERLEQQALAGVEEEAEEEAAVAVVVALPDRLAVRAAEELLAGLVPTA